MGKKNRKKGKSDKKQKVNKTPFVSVCTPTYNRRPFIPYIIKCFESQDYPRDKMEWIIVDDGTDKIEDLVKDLPYVKYYKVDGNKLNLGAKRNLMHTYAKGDIIVYMDDDDYYPSQRVSHAVQMLTSSKKALCAGSSEIYVYFPHIQKTYQFGPYNLKHATAGTFAFKKELLQDTRYDDAASLAEEKSFLKNYTVPFVQLDPLKTILVVSHIHNTFDKKKLLPANTDKTGDTKYCKLGEYGPSNFIKPSTELYDFYINDLESRLVDYEPGYNKMKPDVVAEIERREMEKQQTLINMQKEQTDNIIERRKKANVGVKLTRIRNNGDEEILTGNTAIKMIEELEKKVNSLSGGITITTSDGKSKTISISELVEQYNLLLNEYNKLKNSKEESIL